MDKVEEEFRKVFGDMYLSESETALRIFEYGYKAGVAAENEACARIVDEESRLIADKLELIGERLNSAIAIRVRMG